MAKPSARDRTALAQARKGQKNTQRERLLVAMIAVANRDGCARANVSAVIAAAGVSRPTFYDYFGDKDDCFLAALNDVQEHVLAAVDRAIAVESPARAVQATLAGLIAFARAEPGMARFLTSESMAGGPRALDRRDRGIRQIERRIDGRLQRADCNAAVPDISSQMLIGGTYRVLASRLRRGNLGPSALLEDLLDWVESYARPVRAHRWRSLAPAPSPPLSPHLPEAPLRAPPGLPRGRPRVSDENVSENRRLRIMFAAAQLAEDRGYTASTVSDITKLAGVDSRVFYSMFTDKQDAFMAVHELGFQRTMAVTASAFFAGSSWPERSWEAGRAFTQFLETNPTIAHVGFVEAHAVGPGAVQRVEDSHAAFTIFLQEGYQLVSETSAPSQLALEAIIATIFELVYSRVRAVDSPELSGLLPHLTFLVLAPFLGTVAADEFIDEKL